MPQDSEKRQQWIERIKTNQQFSTNDEHSIRFTVCSEHFEAARLKKPKGRIVPEGSPTIFPVTDELENVNGFDLHPQFDGIEQVTQQISNERCGFII